MPKNPLTFKDVLIIKVNILVPVDDRINPELHGLSDDQIADRISDHVNAVMWNGTMKIVPEESKSQVGDIQLDFDWGISTVERCQSPYEMGFMERQLAPWNELIDNLSED